MFSLNSADSEEESASGTVVSYKKDTPKHGSFGPVLCFSMKLLGPACHHQKKAGELLWFELKLLMNSKISCMVWAGDDAML